MSNLGEDADAFFRSGDEGTYEGGPASVIPFALCDELAEDLTIGATEEQLERRRRLKRLVATIVGALGVGLLCLFTWFVGASARATDGDRPSARPDPPLRATIAAAAPVAQTGFVASPQAARQALTEAATRGEPMPMPSAIAERTVSIEPKTVVPRANPSFEGRPRERARAPSRASVALPRTSVRSTSPVLHSPPTANFPD
jgi:hypothetical protein